MERIELTNCAQVVMYHDQISKNVWRSPDEGKTWNVIGGVPMGDAYMVIEHPYDTRVVSNTPCNSIRSTDNFNRLSYSQLAQLIIELLIEVLLSLHSKQNYRQLSVPILSAFTRENQTGFSLLE